MKKLSLFNLLTVKPKTAVVSIHFIMFNLIFTLNMTEKSDFDYPTHIGITFKFPQLLKIIIVIYCYLMSTNLNNFKFDHQKTKKIYLHNFIFCKLKLQQKIIVIYPFLFQRILCYT